MIKFETYPARVVDVYGASNTYRVVGPYFDGIATWFGEGAGTLGVRSCGGLAPGTQVIVAMVEGDFPMRIIAVDQSTTRPGVDAYAARLLTSPDDQVSGYREGFLFRNVIDGRLRRGIVEARNDGYQDLVNGEWGRVSYFGAGITVEMFRSALRAGHFAELAFYTDDQLGRLRSMKWEHDTMFSEHRDTFYGNWPEFSTRRWHDMAGAVSETALPNTTTHAGPGHLGSSSYRAAGGEPGTPRRALSYDRTDDNGIRVIGAAGGLILERRVDLDVPEEVETTDFAELQAQYDEALSEPRADITFAGTLTTTTQAQSALDIIDGATSYRGRNAVDTVAQRWCRRRLEPTDHLVQGDGSMWGSLPQVVEIVLGQGPKSFYVGRSMFALLPDGSVLVENAHGAQILAAGPNIVLSAPGDIIEMCGGSKQVFAGKNVAMRAYENMDLVANTGRLSAKAERLLSLLGGNDAGDEGVLIESRSTQTTSTAGTGEGNKIGGIMLRSRGGLFASANGDLGLHAVGNLGIRAEEGQIFFDAASIAARVTSALQVFSDADTPSLELVTSGDQTQLHVAGQLVARDDLICQGSGLFTGQIISGAGVFASGSIAGSATGQIDAAGRRTITSEIARLNRSIAAFDASAATPRRTLATFINRDVPMSADRAVAFGFSFLRSVDYNLPGNFGYALPEMRWHQRAGDGAELWEEKRVVSPSQEPTLPYPGFNIWTNSGKYLRSADGLYFDAVSARSTLSEPSSDPGAKIEVADGTALSELVRTTS